MQRLIKLDSILLIFSAIGCGKDAVTDNKPTSQAVQGQASWYGPGLYGNKTTSGEILKKGTMTAARSSLPWEAKSTSRASITTKA